MLAERRSVKGFEPKTFQLGRASRSRSLEARYGADFKLEPLYRFTNTRVARTRSSSPLGRLSYPFSLLKRGWMSGWMNGREGGMGGVGCWLVGLGRVVVCWSCSVPV